MKAKLSIDLSLLILERGMINMFGLDLFYRTLAEILAF